MLQIGQNWGKIANYLPKCSTKIGTPGNDVSFPKTRQRIVSSVIESGVNNLSTTNLTLYQLSYITAIGKFEINSPNIVFDEQLL